MNNSPGDDNRRLSSKEPNEGDRTSSDDAEREANNRSENVNNYQRIQSERRAQKKKQLEDNKNSGTSTNTESGDNVVETYGQRRARKLQQMNQHNDEATPSPMEPVGPGRLFRTPSLGLADKPATTSMSRDLQLEEPPSAAPGDAIAAAMRDRKETLVRTPSLGLTSMQSVSSSTSKNEQKGGTAAAAAPGDDMAASRMNEKEALRESSVSHYSQSREEASRAVGAGAVGAGAGAVVGKRSRPPEKQAATSRGVPSSMVDVEAPHVSTGVDEDGVARPGAYSAPGRAFGAFPAWGRARRESRSTPRRSSSIYDRISARFGRSSRRVPSAYEVNAVLVEEEEERHSSSIPSTSQGALAPENSTPIVEATRIEPEEKIRKRWLYLFVLAVLVVIAVTVAVVVPLSVSESDGSDSGDGIVPPGSPQPTVAPQPTMAPSPFDLVVVTAVLQLDDRPFETSWSLECGGSTLFKIPLGTYTGAENRLVTTRHEAPVGPECELKVEDSGGNGIDGGRVELYFDGNIQDESALIQGVDGNFTDSKALTFVIDVPQFGAGPTAAPTGSVTLFGTALLTVEVQLDQFPTETGWVLVCNDEILANKPALTYSEPNGMIREVFAVQPGASCLCNLTDTFEDGICCGLGEGFYNILYSDAENTNILLATGGSFGGGVSIPFVASPPPDTIQVNIDIELVKNAMTTGWSLTCGGTVVNEVPIGTYPQDSLIITEVYEVDEGADCLFQIENTIFGVDDGEDDEEEEEDDDEFGFFGIILGDVETGWLVGEGDIISVVTAPFIASPRFPRPGIVVLVEIELDLNPRDYGWSLVCGDDVNRVVPTGTYARDSQFILEAVFVTGRADCVFQIEDEGGNGFEEEGFYAVTLSSLTGEEDTEEIIVAAEGTSGSAREFHSAMTTFFRAVANLPPPRVTVNVEIGLDSNPGDTAWSLDCAGSSISRVASFGTYTEASPQVIRESFLMKDGTPCVFRIQDAGGDGLAGNGFFSVKFGDGDDSEDSLTTEVFRASSDGPFEDLQFPFTALLNRLNQPQLPP